MSRENTAPGAMVLGQQRRAPKRARRVVSAWLRPFLIVIVMMVAAGLVAMGLFPLFASAGVAVKVADSKFLSQADVPLDLPPLTQRSTIYAADGTVLATLYRDQNREVFPLSEYNDFTRHAVLAIEDHNFYQHGAVDIVSILRALLANIRAHGIVQGGSTITQQLVKNTETGSAQTTQRKILEAQDAIRLERTYTKDHILELYLNTIYMGNSVYGVGTAAQYYFNKPPHALNIAQSALLAGMIAAPERYNPTVVADQQAVKDRRNLVLGQMLQYGWLTQQQYDTASSAPVRTSVKGRIANRLGPQPYWVDYIKHLFLTDPRFGATTAARANLLYQGGLQIHTTLNLPLQHAAHVAMDSRFNTPTEPQSAVVSINPKTGAILAMDSGNQTYGTGRGQSTLNLGWQALKHTGSAFKGFTLEAALAHGIQPGALYKWHSPVTIPNCGGGVTYTLSNSEGGGAGTSSLRVATWDSINVVFAAVINQVGPQAVVDAAHAMGINRPLLPFCSLTLGAQDVTPLDMTTGYSTLDNGGVHCLPFAISRVVSVDNGLIYKHSPQCHQAIPVDIAATETNILTGVIASGTASGTTHLPNYPLASEAGKTGTDQGFHNAWFVGYIPGLVTGVWVGYREGQTRSVDGVNGLRGFGADQAGPVWRDVMTFAAKGLPVRSFPIPPPEKTGTVPNVVGLKPADADKALFAANFLSSIAPTAIACTQPQGVVCQQSPAAGASVPLGTTVTLTLSNGKPPATPVPNVVGSARDVAKAALTAAGFVPVVVTQVVSDPAQDGIVLAQSPAGGSKAPTGSNVTITVGNFKGTPTPTPTGTTPAPTAHAAPHAGGGRTAGGFPPWIGVVFLGPAGVFGALRRRRPGGRHRRS